MSSEAGDDAGLWTYVDLQGEDGRGAIGKGTEVAQDRGDETGSELDRRAFLKRMAAIAFVAPVISSFTLDAAASADSERRDAHQFHPNQYRPNQYVPNQYVSNQFASNQFHSRQFHPNMHHPNMHVT